MEQYEKSAPQLDRSLDDKILRDQLNKVMARVEEQQRQHDTLKEKIKDLERAVRKQSSSLDRTNAVINKINRG